MDIGEAGALVDDASADPLDRAQACEVLISYLHAVQLEALVQVSEEEPAVEDDRAGICDPAPAEIACALGWTPGMASERLDLARDLVDELPKVLSELREGRIDLGKARVIANSTCHLDPQVRMSLAQRAADYAATHTRGQLRAWLQRRIALIDPEGAERRRKAERARRRVWLQPEHDGMATISAYLTAEEAVACLEALRAGTANIDGSIASNQADLFVALVTGTALGTPIPVRIIETVDGPALAGYGPLSTGHAACLSTQELRVRLMKPQASRHYRPSPAMSRWVQARDRHCRFPGCRRPASRCDLDHVIPYPAGKTTEQNLACLCRYHHKLKTHTGWQARVLPGMTLEWISPRGRIYRTGTDDP